MPWGYFEEGAPLEGILGCGAMLYAIPYVLVLGGCCLAVTFTASLPVLYEEDPAAAIFAGGCFISLLLVSIAVPTIALVYYYRKRRQAVHAGEQDGATSSVQESGTQSYPTGGALPVHPSTTGYAPGSAASHSQDDSSPISPWWWLAPVTFQWLGGLIAWMATKDRDPQKARDLLLLGIVLSVVQVVGGCSMLALGLALS